VSKLHMKCNLSALLAFAFCWSSISAQAGIDFDSAYNLIQSYKYVQAYELLEPIEIEYAGDAEYDLLFGIAALESGNITRAIFALERVLETQPGNIEALALIAKAHFISGEIQASKTELQLVLDTEVPAQVKDSIYRLMSAINEKLNGVKNNINAFVELTIGHDSNINSATNSAQVAIPAFGGAIFTLSNSATKLRANFINPAIGINFSKELNKSLFLFGGATFNQRTNWQQHSFNTANQDSNLGLRKLLDDNTITVALQHNNFNLAGDTYRKAIGINGQWQHNINDHNQASAFIQYSRLEYPKQTIRNADRYLAGASLAHAFASVGYPVLFGSLYGGSENERKSEFPHLGHNFLGMRIGAELSAHDKARLFTGVSYEDRNYGGTEQLWLTSRRDQQWDFNLGARITPAPNWIIRPNLNYTSNHSNVPINKYDRWQISVNFHHDLNW